MASGNKPVLAGLDGNLTQAKLQNMFRYNEATGTLYWRRPGRKRSTFKPAGHVAESDRRCRISIAGHKYLRYQLIWKMFTGSWPVMSIDHINRNPSDDRFENLREVSMAVNCQNRSPKNG